MNAEMRAWRIRCAERYLPYCDTCLMPVVRVEVLGELRHTTPDRPFGIPVHFDASGHEVTIKQWNKNTKFQPAIEELKKFVEVLPEDLRVGDELYTKGDLQHDATVISERVKVSLDHEVVIVVVENVPPWLTEDTRWFPLGKKVRARRRTDK